MQQLLTELEVKAFLTEDAHDFHLAMINSEEQILLPIFGSSDREFFYFFKLPQELKIAIIEYVSL